jgi:hypothetical protein
MKARDGMRYVESAKSVGREMSVEASDGWVVMLRLG